MASTVGIKIANGDFYSIMEENIGTKKRLILTTVHDNQESVQIDLYRSAANTSGDAVYIGSMVVNNIEPKPRGEPSIELILSYDENGRLQADAADMDVQSIAEPQHLTVFLASPGDLERKFDDFEIDESSQGEIFEGYAKVQPKKKKKFPVAALCAVIAACLVAGGLIWFFFLRESETESAVIVEAQVPASPVQAPEPPAETAAPAPAAAPAPVATPPPVAAPPVAAAPAPRPPAVNLSAPVFSSNIPKTIPKGGVVYRVRWGDTLWDIAAAFYKNPWLYQRIARDNGIKNPNRIVVGTPIRILPRN